MQPSDEIKLKLDIVDLIKEYLQLKPAGVNFQARCPFHKEKTPSFTISPEKQIWHCFGCGKGGDIFSFVMDMEGISFVEALRMLAPKAGVVLKKQNPELASKRNRLLDLNEMARKFYHHCLIKMEEENPVKKYLKERGLSQETIEEWQIGYSPDNWKALSVFLKGKGYGDEEIFSAGLSVKGERQPGFYDRFRSRIMFPINDINGQTVAFSARVRPDREKEEKMGKYINSPQTMIYSKSHILFGLDKARQQIKANDSAILTEGQMDAITAYQNGYKNTVASSGTALTKEQISILKRYSNNIALCFDMDKAGELASERGIKEAMRAEMNIKLIELPPGQDPDSCIRKNKDLWQKAVKNAKSAMQYYFDKTFNKLDLAKIEHRREAVKKLLPVIAGLGNGVERDYWLKRLSENIDISENIIRETLQEILKKGQNKEKKPEASSPKEELKRTPREERLSELLLVIIFKFPSVLPYIINNTQVDQIKGEGNLYIYKKLIFYYNNIIADQEEMNDKPRLDYNQFKNWLLLDIEEFKNVNKDKKLLFLDRLAIMGDKDFYDLDLEKAKEQTIEIIKQLKRYYLIERMKEIEKLIAETEKEQEKFNNNEKTSKLEEINQLVQEFKLLSEELKEISN